MSQTATAGEVVTAVGGVELNMLGETVTADGELTSVEGKSDALTAVASFDVIGGGGMSEASILRFLPFGAGSRGGERLYVTVLVTTERTLTGLVDALLGASKNRRVALSQLQSAGENGE